MIEMMIVGLFSAIGLIAYKSKWLEKIAIHLMEKDYTWSI